ncbi:MAG: nitrite reductase large subunit NirB [Solirubrobacteraceae bacterium]|nr:nitrite reductase large subunit NirB [Patulibacter sp.]
MNILIIGGGIAAQSLVEAIRERDREAQITMVCEEPRLPWDRVSLSHLLIDGEVDELQLRPEAWYEDQAVTVLIGRRVVFLDTARSRARLDDDTILDYDRCALATGSDALMPPIPGIDQQGVVAFRSPEDCAVIQAAADAGRPAAVIGGGLLGLEAARGIAARGAKVTVVHLMDRLMERQLDANAAALLAPAMEELDVQVLLGKQTQTIVGDADGHVTGLRFADGEELEAALVVVAIGIRSRTDLAKAAGLEVGRGIKVDDALRTSAPDVFAVGECAEHRGMVYGIVAPIHDQTQIAADAILAGEGAPDPRYVGSILSAKLKIMGVDLVSIGSAEGSGATVEDRDARTYRKLIVENGKLTGAVLMGDTKGYELLLDRVKNGADVEDALELLAEASKASAADLPDGAQICNCNGVCKGEIVKAINEHDLGSTAEVVARTRAGAGCGTCKPLVTELLLDVRGGKVDENTYLCACRKQTREELAAVIRERGLESVSEVAAACGTGRECGGCNPGLAYLVSEINQNQHREERHARFINDRVHGNIQKDGTFSVVPRMKGGVTTADELRRIADAADKYEIETIKVTGGQRIDLLGVKKEDLPAIWEDLGMASGMAYAKSVRTVKTCVGSEHCRFGLDASMSTGIELEGMLEGLYTPAKVKLGVTGCPRNCAEAYIKDIGLVAIEGGWEVYVGGAGGTVVRKGDLLATVKDKDEAISTAITFLQHYRETADYKERSYTYMERVGLEAVQAVVFDPVEGPALRERFHIAQAAAIRDPWLERRKPVVPNQFSELDSEAPVFGAAPMFEEREPMTVGPPSGAAATSDRIAVTYHDPSDPKEQA